MIKKFLPPLFLLVGALVCILACIGTLTAAAAVWLSTYWGLIGGLLATAGGLLVIACLLFLFARLSVRSPKKPAAEPLGETIEALWRTKPVTLMAVAGLATFLLARKPGFIVRVLTATGRSAGAVAMLKRLF